MISQENFYYRNIYLINKHNISPIFSYIMFQNHTSLSILPDQQIIIQLWLTNYEHFISLSIRIIKNLNIFTLNSLINISKGLPEFTTSNIFTNNEGYLANTEYSIPWFGFLITDVQFSAKYVAPYIQIVVIKQFSSRMGWLINFPVGLKLCGELGIFPD